MKDQECPNCGGASPETISEGEFRCVFCNTLFYNESILQMKRAAEKKAAYTKAKQSSQQAQIDQTRTVNNMSKRILLFVSFALLIIFAYVGYMAKKSMDQSIKAQEEIIKSFHK